MTTPPLDKILPDLPDADPAPITAQDFADVLATVRQLLRAGLHLLDWLTNDCSKENPK